MKSTLARGFTLIELLIVIAVLGILAVAVLSAINPIEQINRSRDTGSRSDAEQLISAIDRYYASSNGVYPWQTATTDAIALDSIKVTSTWLPTGSTGPTDSVLGRLSNTGTSELKSSFTNRITATGYNALYIYNTGNTGDSNYVCFAPASGSFQTDAKTRCGLTNLPTDFPKTAACPGTGTTPYWSCLP